MKTKIIIYGGAFDPIHKGHIAVIDHILATIDNIEKVIVVPSKAGPWKKHFLTKGHHRLAMLNLAFNQYNKVEIDDYELKAKGISYSYKLLEYMQEKYPEQELYFVIGEDQVLNFKKWEHYQDVTQKAQILVSQRFQNNKHIDKINQICQEMKFIKLNNKIVYISSTYIRKGNFKNNIPVSVNQYIGKNALYLGNILEHNLSDYRYFHCLNVGKWAGRLADTQDDIDSQKAYITGCLHDVTKEWAFKKQYKYLEDCGLTSEKIAIPVLHSFTGAFWINEEYGILDKDILSAIIKHTTANKKMSKFDKIIFIADKICDDREYPEVEEYRKLALLDLEAAFKKILVYQYKRTKKRQGRKRMNRRTIDAVATHVFDNIFKNDSEGGS